MLALFIFNSCTATDKSEHQARKTDTATKSTTAIISSNNEKIQDSSGSLELRNILKEYLESYKDTIRIDTSFTYEGKIIDIGFRHYCLRDSLLSIPEKYTKIYGLRQFVTHNFQSSLKITVDGKAKIDIIIRKNLFEKKLHQELKDYAILTAPNFSIVDNHVLVDYSISIPLTDVGTSCSLLCDFNGKLVIRVD